MIIPSEIRNWLIIAWEEPIDRQNESYYFDRKDNQFFSIFITDYLLLNDNTFSVNSPYTEEELNTLYDRIERIDKQDLLLVSLPRISIEARRIILSEFFKLYSDQINGLDYEKIIEEENGTRPFTYNNLFEESLYAEWISFKGVKILEHVEDYIISSNIHADSATLWTDKKVVKFELDLKDSEKLKKPKAWWNFW